MVSRSINILLALLAVVVANLAISHPAQASSSRTETLDYQTSYLGHTYRKRALVYLPAGYSHRQRYNLIFLLHGSTESASDFYRDGNFHRLLDRLEKNGQLRKSIVVFPTYYPDRSFVSSDYYRDNRLNQAFAKNELVNDLLPAVVHRYSTYARGTDPAALREARAHQSFGGFSMGAITTWYVFQYQSAYFSTFLPIAGDSWIVEDDGGGSVPQQTAERLAVVAQSATDRPFRILAGVGTADGTGSSMAPQIRAMLTRPEFNHTNLQYYRVPGGSHTPETVTRAFQHYAEQLGN